MVRYSFKISVIFLITLFCSCSEIRTDDPNESYKYWSGTKPTEDLKVVEGKYWQSAHWTREYVLYLKFKPADKWWSEFVNQNHLEIDNRDWDKPSDAPDWFQPSNTSEIYGQGFNDSRYFKDERTGECYIYEIQL